MRRIPGGLVGLSVWKAALLVFVVLAGMLAARFVVHGADPTFFVVASRPPAGPGTVPTDFVLQAPGGGYDGMFFYSLAVNPLQHRDRSLIPLDNPAYRQQRIGYPALAYLLAFGSRAATPWTLLLANLAAIAAVTTLLARRAVEFGRSPLAGAGVALAPALTFALARDLSEPLALALVLAAFATARARRWIATTLLLSLAILTRETVLLAVGALVVGTWIESRADPIRSRLKVVASGTVAVAVAAGWQLFLLHRWQVLPIRAAGADTIGPPFAGIVDAVRTDVERHAGIDALALLLFVFVVLILAGALLAMRRSTAALPEKLLVVGTVVLAVFLGADVWVSFAGFLRALDDAVVFGGLVLLAAPLRFRRAVWLIPMAWLPLATYLVARP